MKSKKFNVYSFIAISTLAISSFNLAFANQTPVNDMPNPADITVCNYLPNTSIQVGTLKINKNCGQVPVAQDCQSLGGNDYFCTVGAILNNYILVGGIKVISGGYKVINDPSQHSYYISQTQGNIFSVAVITSKKMGA